MIRHVDKLLEQFEVEVESHTRWSWML